MHPSEPPPSFSRPGAGVPSAPPPAPAPPPKRRPLGLILLTVAFALTVIASLGLAVVYALYADELLGTEDPPPAVDAGVDAGFDAGFDAGVDAGFDAGFDAGVDAGPAEEEPPPRRRGAWWAR